MKRKVLVALLFLPLYGLTQNSDLGNWLIYFGNKKLNDKWNIHHEAQYRNYNAIRDMEQLLLRTGIGYNLTPKNNNLLLGYGYIQSENYISEDEKISIPEHRIFQQFITRQKAGRVSLQHRYRFEQRWVENQDFKLRFRYFLSLNVPLNNTEMIDKTTYLSAYNEIFINSGNTARFFNRNRIYGGLGYRLNDQLRFEVGYMNQILSTFSRDQINLITFFNF